MPQPLFWWVEFWRLPEPVENLNYSVICILSLIKRGVFDWRQGGLVPTPTQFGLNRLGIANNAALSLRKTRRQRCKTAGQAIDDVPARID
jgi:hypothetical protein